MRWKRAYDFIKAKAVIQSGIQQYEKLIQRTPKAQIEKILLGRGFQVDVYRKPQLLDEKRIDFLLRYAFAGPIGIEVKLTSITDMRAKDIQRSKSFESMRIYMAFRVEEATIDS